MPKPIFLFKAIFAIIPVILFSCQHRTTNEEMKNYALDSLKKVYYGKLITANLRDYKTGASPRGGVPVYGDEQLSFEAFRVYNGISTDTLRLVDTSTVNPDYVLVEELATKQKGWLHHKYIYEFIDVQMWNNMEPLPTN